MLRSRRAEKRSPEGVASLLALFFGEGRAGAFYEEGDYVQEVAALLISLMLVLAAGSTLDYLKDA